MIYFHYMHFSELSNTVVCSVRAAGGVTLDGIVTLGKASEPEAFHNKSFCFIDKEKTGLPI